MKKLIILILTILTIFVLSVGIVVALKSINLKQNCTGYLKRAADANTIESAKEQLQKSIKYLELNNLTKGYTSVMWRTPDEDIEFWYNNLKNSEKELMKVDSTTSTLEKTNILMKLRETLLDKTRKGEEVTVPNGLSRYPDNTLYGILRSLSFIIFIGILVFLDLSRLKRKLNMIGS